MAIVRYTREEMRRLPSATDWERLRNMRDEDIDTSDPDAPEATPYLLCSYHNKSRLLNSPLP